MDVLTILLFFLLGLAIGIWFGYGQGVLSGKKEGKASALEEGKVKGIEEYLRKQIITDKPLGRSYDAADAIIEQAKTNVVNAITAQPKKKTAESPYWFAWILVIGIIVWAILDSNQA